MENEVYFGDKKASSRLNRPEGFSRIFEKVDSKAQIGLFE